MNGVMPSGIIDHINGDRRDDRWANLRDITASMNSHNMRKASRKSKSGVLGVFFLERKQKWTARLRKMGKDYHIGFFDTIDDAENAYIEKKRLVHEGCTI